MSFTSSIAGCPPNSSFIYTTTTVSATNGSFENLSATNASIINLTTVTFNPTNINSSEITTTELTASSISTTSINSSLSTTVDLIATSGTITYLTAGDIEAQGANISAVGADFLTVNKRLFIQDQTNLGLTSYIERDADILKIAGSLSAPDADPNIEFYTNEGTGNPKLKIPSGTDIVEVRALNVVGTAEVNQLLCNDTVETSQLNCNFISSATINNLGLITSDRVTSQTIKGDLSENIAAGSGISLATVAGVTTISNIAQTSDPLNISVLNASTVTTTDLNATNIGAVLVASTDVIATTATAATTNTSTLGVSTINSNHINNATSVITAGLVSDTIHCSSLHSSQSIFANNISYTGGIVGLAGTYLICPDIASVSIISDYIGVSSHANISILNSSTANISNLNSSSIITNSLTGDISSNLSAGTGISLTTVGGVTTIGNTAQTSDPLNLSVLNVSTVNSNHINNATSVITAGLVSDTIHCSSLHSSQTIFANNVSFTGGIVGQAGTYLICPDIASVSIVADDINISSVANISTLNVQTQLTATNASFANISTSGAITSTSLTADISSNLASGTGIALSTALGITTIEATGGLATSTEYGFQVYGNQGNTTVTAGNFVPNNQIQYCFPSSAAYNTGNYTYYVQSPGYYQVGFKIFQLNNAGAGPCRFAIHKNGINELQGGQDVGTTETLTGVLYCNQGDRLDLRITTGLVVIYQGYGHTWFYGYKLQPTNNTVGITTDLTVGTLNALTSITAPTITGDISGNLSQGNNIVLTTALGVTEIGTVPDLTATSLTTTTTSTSTINASIGNLSNINSVNISIDNISVLTNLTAPSSDITIINCSIANTSQVNMVNASITQTLEFADGSSFRMLNTTGSVLYLYNDSTQFNYGTLAGNTGNINFGSGYNSSTIQITGLNEVNMENAAGVNISNTSINNASITTAEIINLSTPLLGVGSFFTRRQNGVYSPGTSSQQYFSNFDTAVVSNPHVSWVTPNIGSGGANTGFIINTSGTYKIDWTFVAHSISYNNRIGWFSRLFKNGAPWDADRYVGFIYTRGDQTSFAQWGSSSSHCIVNLVAGDYIHLVTNVAKATPLHNNLWDQIEGAWGSVCSFQILAFA